MHFGLKSSITRKAVVVAAGVAAVLGSAGGALAATGSLSPASTIAGCVVGSSRTLENVHSPASNLHGCTKGWQATWNVQGQQGPQGPQGKQGPQGAQGPQGPSGVVSTSDTNLVTSPPMSVATGGSFSSGKTQVGTVSLAAGTYLIDINFMATPNEVTTGQVFPQVFVYNGAQKSDFSNDLFNVGSGGLELANASEVASDPIDSYYSGSAEVTVPSGGETLYVYAFGYDADAGTGTYALDTLHVTATALNPAS
ncbi:MAG TPA: hypothetical protein VHU92_18445 [Streptosporangiaceae bacterium]|nr:hypothetical protein [Streptosporangiaceae bacterium]